MLLWTRHRQFWVLATTAIAVKINIADKFSYKINVLHSIFNGKGKMLFAGCKRLK
jgi:hypothetical protein